MTLPIDPGVLRLQVSDRPSERDRHRKAQRMILLVIGCAGVVGALARYAMSRLIAVPTGDFPWSTFWINVSGSFVIGFVLVLLPDRFPRARRARPLIVTGFLGAYTTFSTFMTETDLLFKSRDIATGSMYALGSLGAGTAAAAGGLVLARFILHLERRLREQLG